MRNKIYFIVKILFAASVALFCACSGAPLAGGNSSQTGNAGITVASLSQNISGTTHPEARISIYSRSYLPYATPPGFCDSTVANDSGRFAFTAVPQGYVNLIVNDDPRGVTAFIKNIPVFADSAFADTVDTLKHPGLLAGTATDSAGLALALSYVYVPGSPFYTVTRNDGEFLLGPLPAGSYTISLFANFIVVNANLGQFITALTTVADTSSAVVYPDSISTWHR
ncbi:MAG TPA: hypothetical protein VKF42_00950 [Chitinivibrionales bacterium]|jgi:hypothetical protein|nr:hypothetical protein [Chitinivibrionales bacterium]